MRPPVLILHAPGTNRDREAAWACEAAGGAPEIVQMGALLSGQRSLSEFAMLVLPGGFSHGDALGAGRIWAVTLRHGLGAQVEGFVLAGRPVLGICNGFQALIKSGLLLGGEPRVTLTRNASARFECRWVQLEPDPTSPCVFTRGLEEPILCPAAHGEGRIAALEEATLDALEASGQVALRYATAGGGEAGYPENPNGSARGIAALCNAAGNVMGLMPHPEDHIVPEQHPRHHRGQRGGMGLALFRNGIAHAAQVAGA